jgi:hypothetical protein
VVWGRFVTDSAKMLQYKKQAFKKGKNPQRTLNKLTAIDHSELFQLPNRRCFVLPNPSTTADERN